MATKKPLEKVMTPDEVAEHLGVSRVTVWRLIKDGKLNSFTFGRSRRIAESDLQAFIDNARKTSV